MLSPSPVLRAPRARSITLEKGSEGLGFSIVGGFGSPHGDLPVYVKSVFSKVRGRPNARGVAALAPASSERCLVSFRGRRLLTGV